MTPPNASSPMGESVGVEESSTSSLVEQARLELSVAAAAGERGNRPMHWVFLAGVLLVIAGAYALYNIVSWGGQQAALQNQASQTSRMLDAIDSYKRAVDQVNSRIFDPDPAAGAKLEMLMDEAGLSRVPVAVEDGFGGLARGAKQKQYRATLNDQDPEPVLKWIELALHRGTVSGLALSSLDMRPGKHMPSGIVGWNVTVRFTRWERVDTR